MSKKIVKINRDIKRDMPKTWDGAIADAERMIREAKARVRKLRGSILVFRDRRDSGEAFPGEKTTGS
jgi:hypothetical protein